jgi:hypothetical protein
MVNPAVEKGGDSPSRFVASEQGCPPTDTTHTGGGVPVTK